MSLLFNSVFGLYLYISICFIVYFRALTSALCGRPGWAWGAPKIAKRRGRLKSRLYAVAVPYTLSTDGAALQYISYRTVEITKHPRKKAKQGRTVRTKGCELI